MKDRNYLVMKALAGIGEGLLMEYAGDAEKVASLFEKAIIHQGGDYNPILKTLTEICNHAKCDPDWYADKPGPAFRDIDS